jgi:Ni/Co efflux regulator RcnB
MQRPAPGGNAPRPSGPVNPRPTSSPAWNHQLQGAERDRGGEQWRSAHSGWDRDSRWSQNANWWRDERAFRRFNGVRAGFFFIPAYGYEAAPRAYAGRRWSVGDLLPSWFWRYPVKHATRYGLPHAPQGCVWVWVNNDVALIDRRDGYIIELVRNVW